MSSRNLKDRGLLLLKGVAMGAADVVPGVSGGTIAFITGIYEELLGSISKIGPDTWKAFRSGGIKAAWIQVNGSFLLNLILGILLSIAGFSYLIRYLLEHHPIPLWAFFFGLIIASVILVGKQVRNRTSLTSILGIISGTLIAYFITIATPSVAELSLPYIFLCGVVAITAMILPGISGSFILLLMGAYAGVLGSISGFIDAARSGEWEAAWNSGRLLGVFAVGCVLGLLSFSRLLTWMFRKAHDLTVSVLTGFLIGSLNKIWPWKITDEVFVKHPGTPEEEIVPLVQHNVMPLTWTTETGEPSQVGIATIALVLGIALILILDRFAPKAQKA